MILLFRRTHRVSMALVGRWLGISRTAVYKACGRWEDQTCQSETIAAFVREQRQINKRMSGVKLHILFKASVQGQSLPIGRDRFYEVMRENNLVLRKAKRRKPGRRNPVCMKMENLTKGLKLLGPNHLIVADDTEIKCKDGKGHLALITDAYSRMVTGFAWSRSANAKHVQRAMKMTLSHQLLDGVMALIHHSDLGSIYISELYLRLLGIHNIRTSFSPPGSPQCNPVAERINGIIKQEYLCDSRELTFEQIGKKLQQIINHYNEVRPHMSCDMRTPGEVHRLEIKPKKRWKGRTLSYKKEAQFPE